MACVFSFFSDSFVNQLFLLFASIPNSTAAQQQLYSTRPLLRGEREWKFSFFMDFHSSLSSGILNLKSYFVQIGGGAVNSFSCTVVVAAVLGSSSTKRTANEQQQNRPELKYFQLCFLFWGRRELFSLWIRAENGNSLPLFSPLSLLLRFHRKI